MQHEGSQLPDYRPLMKDGLHSPHKNDSSGRRRDPIGSVVVIRALVKDVAQMLPEEKLGASPREAMCAARP